MVTKILALAYIGETFFSDKLAEMAIPREDFGYIKMSNKLKLTIEEKSYLAGFLDADGSIFAQIVRNQDLKYGFRIRISIGFYQKTTKHWFLLKLKKILKYGYVRVRKDGVSEYVVTSSDAVRSILLSLKNSVILKKKNVDIVLKIIEKKKKINSKEEFIELCKLVDKVADLNYSKNRKITADFVGIFLKI